MNAKVFMVLRIIFGLFLLTFGLNKFLQFLPMDGEMSDGAATYFEALMSTNTMVVVAIVEILTGLALLLNKFGALMSLILMSVSVNAVMFHAFLEPGSIAGAAAMLVLNIVMLYGYRDKYAPLLQG